MKLLIHSQTSTVQPLKFWEWISNFNPNFTGHVIHLSMLGLRVIRVSKRGPRNQTNHNKTMCTLDALWNMIFELLPTVLTNCPLHKFWHGHYGISTNQDIWRLRRQKQVSQAGISNYIPQFTVGCNYLSLPEIPASGTKVLISALVPTCTSSRYLVQYDRPS